MKANVRSKLVFYWKVVQKSVQRFIDKDTLTQSAAISYYMVFSLPPMLVVILWAAGIWYEESIVREAVFIEFGQLIGKQGATQLKDTLAKISADKPTLLTTIIGIGVLCFTATTVLLSVKRALNIIFGVSTNRSPKQGIIRMIIDRFLSLAMLCIIGILLTISLVVSAMIAAFSEGIKNWLGESTSWFQLFDHFIPEFFTLSILLALTYRYVPDVRMKWKDTWLGAIFTALLFIVGKSIIQMAIGQSDVSNYYDAAGGLLVLMLWVYYSSAIVLFGATLTDVSIKSINNEG